MTSSQQLTYVVGRARRVTHKGKTKIESLKDLCEIKEKVANSPVNNRIYSVHNVQKEFQINIKLLKLERLRLRKALFFVICQHRVFSFLTRGD